MALSSIKASTQDGTSGTPVATVVNEDDSTKAIQGMSPVGSKTTWSEASRTGLTASDAPTGGDLTTTGFAGSAGANLGDAGNALALAVRATCNAASSSLSGRVVLYDGSNNPLGTTEKVAFTSDATLRLGNASGNFVCQSQLVDCRNARKFRFLVDSVTAGTTWSVFIQPV